MAQLQGKGSVLSVIVPTYNWLVHPATTVLCIISYQHKSSMNSFYPFVAIPPTITPNLAFSLTLIEWTLNFVLLGLLGIYCPKGLWLFSDPRIRFLNLFRLLMSNDTKFSLHWSMVVFIWLMKRFSHNCKPVLNQWDFEFLSYSPDKSSCTYFDKCDIAE